MTRCAWVYFTHRYLIPAALFTAINGIGFLLLLACGHACGWI